MKPRLALLGCLTLARASSSFRDVLEQRREVQVRRAAQDDSVGLLPSDRRAPSRFLGR